VVGVGGLVYQRVSRPSAGCRAHDSKPATNGSPVAVVLGDSYSVGASPNGDPQAWPTVLGHQLRWKVYVNAISGTGVTTGGSCEDPTFLDRLPKALRHHPQTLIVQTGLNDTSAPPGAVGTALTRLLRQASAVPELVVVGPPLAPAKPPRDVRRVDAELSAACPPPRCRYLSALTWRFPYLPDRVHPTVEGQARFARYVASALRQPAG
jgi:lysophospholipase L1-like esterase